MDDSVQGGPSQVDVGTGGQFDFCAAMKELTKTLNSAVENIKQIQNKRKMEESDDEEEGECSKKIQKKRKMEESDDEEEGECSKKIQKKRKMEESDDEEEGECSKQMKLTENEVVGKSADFLEDISSESEEELESDSDLDMFERIEETGEEISQSLADSIDKGLGGGIDNKTLYDTMDNIKRPKNCTNLVVPKTNGEIYRNLYFMNKARDRKLQKTQLKVVKALTLNIQILDKVRKARKSKKQIDLGKLESDLKDVIKISVASMGDINMRRLENVQSSLPRDLKPICKKPFLGNENSGSNSTEFLLGGDISNRIKEIGEEQKLSQRLKNPKNFQGPRPLKSNSKGPAMGAQRGKNRRKGIWNKRQFQNRK